ncbi:DUF4296 domain-containing protein [Flagellimonas beolgyonensis]|uniref:DUF4296 domain-containing protein n=1 Tax=Flagellimonas beolgyonensis TaxID=864064 RepID=UPI000F8E6AAB|nr:DUF4296 domain-containing protein [Allomuricauda beolgyonensis]
MKKGFVFLMGILFLCSCAEEVVEKPENLIPKDKMAAILLDLAILNAAKSAAKNKFEDSGLEIMPFLYQKYGVDSVQFVQSDLYYASNPLQYQEMYQDVQSKLDLAKKDLEERSKRRSDSIRKANETRNDSVMAAKAKEKLNPIEP